MKNSLVISKEGEGERSDNYFDVNLIIALTFEHRINNLFLRVFTASSIRGSSEANILLTAGVNMATMY